jgi:hypothetical protein
MFSLFAHQSTVRTICCFAKGAIPEGSVVDSLEKLKVHYLGALAQHCKRIPVNLNKDLFIYDQSCEDQIAKVYGESKLNDLSQSSIVGAAYEPREKLEKINLAKVALEELLNLDKNLSDIFNLAIHSIIIRDSAISVTGKKAHGGSSSAGRGVIWLSMHQDLPLYDHMELFLHELTHNLIFIDELQHPQFDYSEMSKSENSVLSAILCRKRPMDKVLHSIIVACEILLARQSFLPDAKSFIAHPPTRELLAQTQQAIASVYELASYETVLKPRGRELLERCREVCQQLNS